MKQFVCPICGYVHEGPTPPEKCPQCGSYMVEKRNSRKGLMHVCANENCHYRETVDAGEDEDE